MATPSQLPDQTTVMGPGSGSTMDRVRQVISNITGGGTPAIDQHLQQAHDLRVNTANMYKNQAATLARTIMQGQSTGKDADGSPWTPEKEQAYRQQWDEAWGQYGKIAGVNKDAKSIIQRVGEVAGHLMGHHGGQPAAAGAGQATAPAAAPAPAGQGSAAAPAGGMPPPPSPTTAATAAGVGMPPPPNPMMAAQGAPILEEQRQHQVQLAQQRAQYEMQREELAKDTQREFENLVAIGVDPKEAQRVIAFKHGGAGYSSMMRPRMHPITYTDPTDPTRTLNGLQDANPNSQTFGTVFGVNGEEVQNPGKVSLATLPTVGTSTYNTETGTTTTTSRKVVPGQGGAKGAGAKPTMPAPPQPAGGPNQRTAIPQSGGAPAPAPAAPSPTAQAKPQGRIAAMAEQWATNGVEPAAKDRPAVQAYMQKNNVQPTVKPTQAEIKLRDDLKKVEPMVDNLEKFLVDKKMTQMGEGGMFNLKAWGDRAKVEKAWQEYSHGLPPADKDLGQLIKYAAAIKIMGAAPWMTMGRGKYLYSEVVQHLPEPTDTPAQLFQKVQFYRTILEDARNSLPPSLQEGSKASESPAPQQQFSHVSSSGKYVWDGTKWIPNPNLGK